MSGLFTETEQHLQAREGKRVSPAATVNVAFVLRLCQSQKTLLDKATQSWGQREGYNSTLEDQRIVIGQTYNYKTYFSISDESRILMEQPSEQIYLNSFKKNTIY